MPSPKPVVGVWFRKALRLRDNWALLRAAEFTDAQVVPFFVLDTTQFTKDRFSANRFRFLFEALRDLDSQLKSKFGADTHGLVVFRGNVEDVLESLCKGDTEKLGIPSTLKLTNLLYEFDSGPYGRERDARVTEKAQGHGVAVEAFGGHTILDIRQCKEKKVKMPTTSSMIQNLVKSELGGNVPMPKAAPAALGELPTCLSPEAVEESLSRPMQQWLSLPEVEEMGYTAKHPLSESQFPGGETEALKRLQSMVTDPKQQQWVSQFQKPKTSSTNIKTKDEKGADEWTTPSTTGLSPYLAQGSLSVRDMWHAVQQVYDRAPEGKHTGPPMSLHGQLLFREMFYVQGYCVENYHLPEGNAMCKDIKWGGGESGTNGTAICTELGRARLKAWQEGNTGFPLIDAYMRQLVATGWIHHLGRHAVACFLTRGDLYLSWVHGRDFFDKHLLDGDWAVNNGNWLWLAGVAPFSMPFFRVYSPIPPVKGAQSALNAEQSGDFVRYWIPELKHFPTKFIYEPWKASTLAQQVAKCIIGKDYPKPIVDHPIAREANLSAYKASNDEIKLAVQSKKDELKLAVQSKKRAAPDSKAKSSKKLKT